MARSKEDDIIERLSSEITHDVGNNNDDELENISDTFMDALNDALKAFNSNTFDDDGFIKKMRTFDTGDKKDKDAMRNVLNNIRSDYINVDSMNQSELLLRRDISNICYQMPEMHDAINVVRDAIIECNVSTGEVSRSIMFLNHEENESYESQVKDLENRFRLLMAIKNFLVPKILMHGEYYVHLMPFSKLFAELEMLHERHGGSGTRNFNTTFKESVPTYISESFSDGVSLYNERNFKVLTESVSTITKTDASNLHDIDEGLNANKPNIDETKADMKYILENIMVYNGSSELMSEYGAEGFKELIFKEYKNSQKNTKKNGTQSFMEAQYNYTHSSSIMNGIDQDDINVGNYNDIKGCYIKYLDGLRLIPLRIDRTIIGYYYVTTTMDLQTNSANPNGIIDVSYQNYMRDRNMVDQLSSMIINSFDKKVLDRNIHLKNEIAEVIMAHKFSEGRLSFVYIPADEVVRIVINEDEEGKGHSMLEPTIFPARMYLMLNLYNMLYTLNNNTTRVHYLKSSGLNKDYAASIQRTMRKFQSRRITIDDIYSYSGVLNKIGGMGEMVLPAGRNDYKALETDTIEAVNNPINIEFLEQQRRQAISGTGVPHLLVINAIDEIDFAKTLEMANARFISTASSYKIDMNAGITELYQRLLRYCTNIEEDVIQSFRFKFNTIKQQELVITNDMIQNFNSMVEMVQSIYYTKNEMEDEKGNPTVKQMHLRKELAREYLPQLDFDLLEDIVKRVNLQSVDNELQDRVNKLNISDENLNEVND